MASIVDRPTVVFGTPLLRRAVIVVACALAGAAAFALGDPGPRLAADPETARLLQSMALIKAMFLVPALALVLWRVRYDIGAPLLLGYSLCVVLMSAATVSVFQLSHLGLTSFAFHGCLLGLLVLAWHDSGVAVRLPGRR